MAEKSQCQTDIFSVTSPGNNAPPQICGTNTGEHSKYIFFSFFKKRSIQSHKKRSSDKTFVFHFRTQF